MAQENKKMDEKIEQNRDNRDNKDGGAQQNKNRGMDGNSMNTKNRESRDFGGQNKRGNDGFASGKHEEIIDQEKGILRGDVSSNLDPLQSENDENLESGMGRQDDPMKSGQKRQQMGQDN